LGDHEEDTEDIPDGLDPNGYVIMRDEEGGWMSPDQINAQLK